MENKNLTAYANKNILNSVDMPVYTGRVTVSDDRGNYIYSSSTGITRTNKCDAVNDAEKLKAEMLCTVT